MAWAINPVYIAAAWATHTHALSTTITTPYTKQVDVREVGVVHCVISVPVCWWPYPTRRASRYNTNSPAKPHKNFFYFLIVVPSQLVWPPPPPPPKCHGARGGYVYSYIKTPWLGKCLCANVQDRKKTLVWLPTCHPVARKLSHITHKFILELSLSRKSHPMKTSKLLFYSLFISHLNRIRSVRDWKIIIRRPAKGLNWIFQELRIHASWRSYTNRNHWSAILN